MILTVSKNADFASSISDMLYFTGILSYPTSAVDAISELSLPYRAVLFVNRDSFFDEEELAEIIHSYAPSLPIFSHGGNRSTHISAIKSSFSLSESIALMQNEVSELGIYSTESLCEEGNGTFQFCKQELPFTKTEVMILRSVIRFQPCGISTEEILKFAFRKRRTPDKGSIRTHISLMNKKFKQSFGIPLFEYSDGKYMLYRY